MSKKESLTTETLIAMVLLSTTIPLAYIDYLLLKKKHLNLQQYTRIIDVGRAFSRASKFATLIFGIVFVLGIVYVLFSDIYHNLTPTNKLITLTALSIFSVFLILNFVRILSAGFLGVVVDFQKGVLVFPSDGIIRDFSLSSLINSFAPSRVDVVHLSGIKQITRQAGRVLIISGDFGSRAISFSDKLRRDELLGYLSNYKKHGDFERAAQDDYE